MKIVQIVGARPQFIKYFSVSRAIKEFNSNSGSIIKDILVHTGQHYDYRMSEVFFKQLGIKKPDYHLGIGFDTPASQTARMMQKIEDVLIKEKPNLVIVYGDTNSTLAGALAAAKLNLPIAHIEAGLRSYNPDMPEEINRMLTDRVSSLLFCPTQKAIENLKKEGIVNNKNKGFSPLILNVGDVMYDVLLFTLTEAKKASRILSVLKLVRKNYCVLTIHRQRNCQDPDKLKELAQFVNKASGGKAVIFPLHPRNKHSLVSLKKIFLDNIRIIEPLGYFDMIELTKNSLLLFTDSGGLQKESYWLGVPCITLRNETEWVETMRSGWNVLYRDYRGRHNIKESNRFAYGRGNAAKRIVNIIIKFFKQA